ncbi:MAG: hypothetical protein IJK33_04340 [Clostridia bacterium]|nr:hypothetical protein [Clostridia bacterium]MBQ7500908.1 hypothetical protein [Clostridia bacterium]
MKTTRTLFDSIPDTVVITDTYGYILDFNRKTPFDNLKKGKKLTSFLPDCFDGGEGEFRIADKVFRRYTAKLDNGKNDTGYTVRLSDITEEARLDEQLQHRSRELAELEHKLSESNAKLTEFVMRVKELADYSEQLRIARVIHDDYGHALTELFVICQMCLTLKDTAPERCRQLLHEGSEICRRATEEKRQNAFGSLSELLYDFAGKSAFPTEVTVAGEEPPFIKEKYELIGRICKEAYHNTLEHSLANRFYINAEMDEEQVTLTLTDDGSFHGTFEKGFGLSAMENAVKDSNGTIGFITEEGKGFTVRITWRRES